MALTFCNSLFGSPKLSIKTLKLKVKTSRGSGNIKIMVTSNRYKSNVSGLFLYLINVNVNWGVTEA